MAIVSLIHFMLFTNLILSLSLVKLTYEKNSRNITSVWFVYILWWFIIILQVYDTKLIQNHLGMFTLFIS